MTRTRRVLALLAALTGLLLTGAGACDTGAAPSAPPATMAPSPDSSDDPGDDSGDDSGAEESEGPDDGGLSGRGNTGESR